MHILSINHAFEKIIDLSSALFTINIYWTNVIQLYNDKCS